MPPFQGGDGGSTPLTRSLTSMSKQEKKYAVASVKAFIERDGRILILRESAAYKGGSQHGRYVMPGGKVGEGEHFLDALKREIKEECGLRIEVGRPFHTDEWRIHVPGKPTHIVGTYFRCRYIGGEVALNSEFDSFEWIKPAEYDTYDLNQAARNAFRSYLDSMAE